MAIEVLLPRLGWDMESGSLVEWVKQDGDAVRVGDVICLIEGDKAVTEIEAMDAGTLHIPPSSPPIGARVPVGTLIAYLLEPGEAPPTGSTPTGTAPGTAPLGSSGTAGAPSTEVTSPEPASTDGPGRSGGASAGVLQADWAGPADGATDATANEAAGSRTNGSSRTPVESGAPGGPVPLRAGASIALGDAVAPPPGATLPTSRRGGPRISPRARRVARELGVDWTALAGGGLSGRIRERDVRAAAQTTPAVGASVAPVATGTPVRAADAADVPGAPGALGGKAPMPVVPAPARAAPAPVNAEREAGFAAAASGPTVVGLEAGPAGAGAVEAVPLSGVRRLIAERMSRSARTVAPVTLTTEADATELVRLRAAIAADLAAAASGYPDAPVPAYDVLLGRLVAVALRDHPDLNASLDGDTIRRHAAVNLGFAVDTERGLLVVVVHDAGRKSISELAAEWARLVEAARSGRVEPGALRGGTFTLTNLGMYEVDAFTPIVNLPECAILGIGRIVARPVVVDEATEQVAVRRMLTLSLTVDHRLVDGAPAARFLQQVKRYVERPTLWLVR